MDNPFKLQDLPVKYQTLAKIIGLENFLKLAKLLGGEVFYFPKLRHLSVRNKNKKIIEEFNGHNVADLARRYRMTTRNIYRILSEGREKEANVSK